MFASQEEFVGELAIGLAGLEVGAGVVVSEDDGGGFELQGTPEDELGIDDSTGAPAGADLDAVDDVVGAIEAEHPAFLVVEIGD